MSVHDWQTLTVEVFPVECILSKTVLPFLSKPRKSLDHQSIEIVKKWKQGSNFRKGFTATVAFFSFSEEDWMIFRLQRPSFLAILLKFLLYCYFILKPEKDQDCLF